MTPEELVTLPPTQMLIMGVLGARYRTGEHYWTFHTKLRPALQALQDMGALTFERGGTPHTLEAKLTESGMAGVLKPGWKTPHERELARLNEEIRRLNEIIATMLTDRAVQQHAQANL